MKKHDIKKLTKMKGKELEDYLERLSDEEKVELLYQLKQEANKELGGLTRVLLKIVGFFLNSFLIYIVYDMIEVGGHKLPTIGYWSWVGINFIAASIYTAAVHSSTASD